LGKNLPLIAGIGIPVLMILLVVASVRISSFFARPSYNFVFAMSNHYNPYVSHKIKDGKIQEIREPCPPEDFRKNAVTKLYLYDVVKEESREISL
jgi:hypothetical protein